MSFQFTIRPFQHVDIQEIVNLWNRALPIDAVSLSVFEAKVLLDENFDPEGLLVAESEGSLIGFVYALVRQFPMPLLGLQEEKGWVTAWGVDPDYRRSGVGSALIEAAEKFFKKHHRKQIIFSTYSPNYITPGIDSKAYSSAIALLEKLGFEKWSEFLSMDNNLVHFQRPDKAMQKEKKLKSEGIEIRFYERRDITRYLEFQREHMPPDWLWLSRNNLLDLTRGLFEPDQICIALDKGKIIGFCQHEDEHFGPFGVSDDYQGRGIGTVLLARTLERMHQKGLHGAWLLWTGDRAATGVYGPLGFKETRRFAAMKKEI